MSQGTPERTVMNALPEPVINAIVTTAGHLKEREPWIPDQKFGASWGVPRLIAIAAAASTRLSGRPSVHRMTRQSLLKAFAYVGAGPRVAALIDLAHRSPEALDDLLVGPIDARFSVYRYNIMTSLGIFARHGLINEVLTIDRMNAVSQSLDSIRQRRPLTHAAQQNKRTES